MIAQAIRKPLLIRPDGLTNMLPQHNSIRLMMNPSYLPQRRIAVILSIGMLISATGLREAGGATVFSNLGQGVDNSSSWSAGVTRRYATDFVTGTGSVILTDATLLMKNFDDIPHAFTASIYLDAAGSPGTFVGSFDPFTVPAGVSALWTEFTATSAGITLAASTSYWITMQMNEARNSSYPSWAWDNDQGTDGVTDFATDPATGVRVSFNSGSTYAYNGDGNYMFALNGTPVPEPSRALLLVGALGMLFLHRRR